MGAAVNFDLQRGSRLCGFAAHPTTRIVGAIFIALLALQAAGLFVLGTGRAGQGLSECILVVDNLLALICVWKAARRAHGIATLFWFLFVGVVVVLLAPTALQAYDTIFGKVTLSDTTRGLLYCLYGAPVLMMLFLPETHGRARVKSEVFLDLFQIAIVISLIYSTFFFSPALRLPPADAFPHSVSITNAQSLILMIAAFVRMQFSRVPATRELLLRLTLFLAVCAIMTFAGAWVDVHHHPYSPWFDLGWALPVIAAALIVVTWTPSPESTSVGHSPTFLSSLGANLVLIAMLAGIALFSNLWKQTYGVVFADIAIAASLLALTLRLALTQFHQQMEIAHRKSAQDELIVATGTIQGLLEVARSEASVATQIGELGAALQACQSREEAFHAMTERMTRFLPGTSGALSVLNDSGNHVQIVAEWGLGRPRPAQTEDAGCSSKEPARAHPVSVPLVSHGEALGVLTIWDNPRAGSVLPPVGDEMIQRRNMGSVVAEQLALTISNLDLREALRSQATRDPLTGLYNRRSMQEFLDREAHRARRRGRPLAVMMIDVDHFKLYNDTFGHGAGDEALLFLAETLTGSVRAEDLACRYGGEEFVVLLPDCALPQAAVRAEEIRTRLKTLQSVRARELPINISVSIGVAGFQETTSKIDLLLKFADDALYQAKREGRDRVVVAQPEKATPALPPQPQDHLVAAAPDPVLRS